MHADSNNSSDSNGSAFDFTSINRSIETFIFGLIDTFAFTFMVFAVCAAAGSSSSGTN